MITKIKDKALAKVRKLIGWCISILFGAAILGFFINVVDGEFEPSDISAVIICCALLALGVYLIFSANRRIALIESSKSYYNFISAGQNSFSDIARAVGESEEAVAKKIVIMIKRGYIKDVYLDSSKRTVVCKDEPTKIYVSVRCEGCNAVAKVQEGTVATCEFCGAYLSTK